MAETVLALDLGGSKIAAALVRDGRILDRRQLPTPPAPDLRAIIDTAVATAGDWPRHANAVGVATAGLVQGGRLDAVNREIWHLTAPSPFAEPLSARLGLPVTLVNDGAAAAWGEHRFGAGQGVRNLLFMTISTGIGGGLVVDGRLVTGRQGLAGHVGFLGVDPAGPACGSGRVGTLESLASGRALERQASALFGRPVSPPDLLAMTDPRAVALVDAAAACTSRAIGGIVALLDPDLVIVGGGLGLAAGYLDRIRAALALERDLFRLPLVSAALGADAGLVGAADLALK
ncbi:MAG: ROK family protein [Geminicoccaceae bacterium]